MIKKKISGKYIPIKRQIAQIYTKKMHIRVRYEG